MGLLADPVEAGAGLPVDCLADLVGFREIILVKFQTRG